MSEIAAKADFDHIRYAQLWEDGALLVEAMGPMENKRLVSIASAGDNAIAALEAGAKAVHMFCRRDTHRRQQVYRWVMSAGFLRHCADLDDEWRWRFVSYILETRMAMPTETWNRLAKLPGFQLHTSANWRGFVCK